MDVTRNHLVNEDFLERLSEAERKEYTPVPPELHRAAKRKLHGNQETFVSKHSGGKLSKWAAQKRKEKRKAQKLARKQNR